MEDKKRSCAAIESGDLVKRRELNQERSSESNLMVSVKYSEIPAYLRRSAFYLSLDNWNSEVDDIVIPARCFWKECPITDMVQFELYLHTAQFWGLNFLNMEGLAYCFQRTGDNNTVDHLVTCMNTIREICGIKSTLYSGLCSVLSELDGYDEENNWLVDPISTFDEESLLEILPKLEEHDLNKVFMDYASWAGEKEEIQVLYNKCGSIWDERTCARAAHGGHLACLQYLVDNNCRCDSLSCIAAAYAGHISVLKYLHSLHIGFDPDTKLWPPDVAAAATALATNLPCLQYIHELGCPWDEQACSEAAALGHLEMLQYLHDHGCPWDHTACTVAAKNGQLLTLMYLHDMSCPWDAQACTEAAENGHLDVVQYLHVHGCPWQNLDNNGESDSDYSAADGAAHGGHLEILQYVVENGCPVQSSTVHFAANAPLNSVPCLKYLVEDHLLPLSEETILSAFQRGDFECVQYLMDVDVICPYEHFVFDRFYKCVYMKDFDGFFKCLQLLLERGWQVNKEFLEYVDDITELSRSKEYLEIEQLLPLPDAA